MSDRMGTAIHRVTLTDDSTFGHGTFTCEGGPDDACHQYPSCECEVWGEGENGGPHEHPDERQAECWLTPWLNGYVLSDTYSDDEGHSDLWEWRSGVIRCDWQGDYLTWQYATTGAAS